MLASRHAPDSAEIRNEALAIGREIIKKAEEPPRSYEVFISYRHDDRIAAASRRSLAVRRRQSR
jgi:hypothetical protein